MSEAFVVLNDGWDEKTAIMYPDIFGPFESAEQARDFIRKHPRCEEFGPDSPWVGELLLMPIDGGYAGAHIVSRETASDPTTVLAEWAEEMADMEGETGQ